MEVCDYSPCIVHLTRPGYHQGYLCDICVQNDSDQNDSDEEEGSLTLCFGAPKVMVCNSWGYPRDSPSLKPYRCSIVVGHSTHSIA